MEPRFKNFEELKDWQQEQMQKCGWFTHYVFDDGSGQLKLHNGVDFHTHGMDETYHHLDFQIVFPISEKIVNSIFWGFADLLKEGNQFASGDRVSGIIKNYDVLLLEVENGGRRVLRIILPDVDGNLEEKDLKGVYAAQYEN